MNVSGIYDDVSSVDLGEQLTQLEEQNKKLLQHKQTLENDIMKLCTELTQMKTEKDNLERNISELFKTAKREIERKDRMIADLQRQLDDLILRRIKQPYNENKEPKTGYVAYKRSRDDAASESDNNKRLKCETGDNNVCNVVKAELGLPHPKEVFQKVASKHFSDRSHSRSPIRTDVVKNAIKSELGLPHPKEVSQKVASKHFSDRSYSRSPIRTDVVKNAIKSELGLPHPKEVSQKGASKHFSDRSHSRSPIRTDIVKNATKSELRLLHPKEISQKLASKHFSNRSRSRSPLRRDVVKNSTEAELGLPHPKEVSQKLPSKHFSNRSRSRSPVRRDESVNRRKRDVEHSYRSEVYKRIKSTDREHSRSQSKEHGQRRNEEHGRSRSKEHGKSRSKESGQNKSNGHGRSKSREKNRLSHRNRNDSNYLDKYISKDRFNDVSKYKDKTEMKSKRHNPPLNKSTKIRDKIKLAADSSKDSTYIKPKVKQKDCNVKSKICNKEESEKSDINIDCEIKNLKKDVDVEPVLNINKTETITDKTTSKEIKQVSTCTFTNGYQENVKIATNFTITLENRSVNTNGTNEIKEEIATTSNTDKVEEIQINAANDNKGDNSVNQNVVVNNCVSDGQMVNNSRITLDTQLSHEPNETVIKEEPLNIIQSCNISNRESISAKRRRRCVIKIVNE